MLDTTDTHFRKPVQLPKRGVLLLMLCIAFGLVLYSLLFQLSGLLTLHDFSPNFLSLSYTLIVKIWLYWAALSIPIAIYSLALSRLLGSMLLVAVVHIIAFLILSLAHNALLAYHYHFFTEMRSDMLGYAPWQHIGHFMFGDNVFWIDVTIYTLMTFTLHSSIYHKQLLLQHERTFELDNALNHATLNVLRMQINPHFLYNTLASISVLIQKSEHESAVRYIQKLATFFRNTLNTNGDALVPVEQELECIRQYLELEKLRFSDKLALSIHCSRGLERSLLPSFILQPLVENAVIHGIAESEEAGIVSVNITGDDNTLTITITDTGAGFNAKQPEGVGLSNIRSRLALHYGPRGQLLVSNHLNGGTEATLTIPKEYEHGD